MSQNKVFQNAKWIIVCKILQSVLQLVIGMVTARYLGPSNYGLINYAASIVAFAVPIMQLGLPSILVQEYVERPKEEGAIVGTSLVMSLVSGIACIIGVLSFVAIANQGEQTTILVCALYSISIICRVMELLQYWFQKKLLSKYSSMAVLAAYVVVSAYKVYLLICGKSIYWFAVSHGIEYACAGLLLLIAYRSVNGEKLSFSWNLAKAMFRKSKYYILANLMVTIFQNTDHVMLKMMVGDAENGFYTTAVTCASVTQFVFFAIIDSARPVILEKRKESISAFETKTSELYTIIIYATLVQAICFAFFSELIVYILYGKEYLSAVPVLQILAWQSLFSYIGSVRNIWILGQEKYTVLWKINLCGVLANVVLNAMMIPVWGACGAAFASLLTQFVTNFIVGFIMKPIRQNNRLLLRGMHPRSLFRIIRKITQHT